MFKKKAAKGGPEPEEIKFTDLKLEKEVGKGIISIEIF